MQVALPVRRWAKLSLVASDMARSSLRNAEKHACGSGATTAKFSPWQLTAPAVPSRVAAMLSTMKWPARV